MTELDDTALSNTLTTMTLDASGKEIERLQATNTDLLEALKRLDKALEMLWDEVDWKSTFLSSTTIKELNEAPTQAKQAIRKAEEQA